ncbi:MAG: hypothetical protein K8L91_27650, partial [Anaerolineae bacterium]|nr:hypothetical protein [Anaerolineae bacterium]
TKLYVVTVDGTTQVQTVENLNRVTHLMWSPVYDYLAIIRRTRAGNSGGAEEEYEILLLDTQFGDIITRQIQTAYAIEEIAWSHDGETFSVYYSVRVSQDYAVPLKYKRLDVELDDDFSRTDVSPTACEQPVFDFPGTLHDATVDMQNHQLHFDDDASLIDLPPGFFQSLQWSPDGEQMVVWMRDECEAMASDASYHAWYYRIGEAAFQEIASNVARDDYSGQALWSLDSQWAALAGWDGNAYVVGTASSPLNITLIHMPLDFGASYAAFQWTPDQTLYLQPSYGADSLYALPVGATEFAEVPDLSEYPDRVYFSTDARYVTFAGTCSDAGELVYGAACVVDRQTNTTVIIYPHGGSGTLGYQSKEIYWHPAVPDWMLIVNGGGAGGGEQFIQVANAQGTVRRELTSCVYTQCYGWVSDNISVDTIPPFETALSIPTMTLTGMKDYVMKAEWNSPGTLIAVSSLDGSTYLFDAASGQLLRTVMGQIFDWSPDGTTIATIDRQVASNDAFMTLAEEGAITFYDAVTGEVISVIEGSYYTLDFDPYGEYLAVSSQSGEVSIYEVATGALAYNTEFPAGAVALAFSPDGQRLAIGGLGNEVWVWDYASDGAPQVYTFENTTIYLYGIFAFDWKPDGTQLIGSGGPGMFFFGNNSVVFDLASGETRFLIDGAFATFTSDGQYTAQIDDYNGFLQIIGADDRQTALRLYLSGWWLDFDPAMSQIMVTESYVVTIWQLP